MRRLASGEASCSRSSSRQGWRRTKIRSCRNKQLLTAVWSFTYRDDLDYLRAYIRYLRHKFEADPANPKLIVAYPGVGYSLECPEEKLS